MRITVKLNWNCVIRAIILGDWCSRFFFVKASLRETLHSNKIFKVYQPISNRKVYVVVVKRKWLPLRRWRCPFSEQQHTTAIFRTINLYRFYYCYLIYLFFYEILFEWKILGRYENWCHRASTSFQMETCYVTNRADLSWFSNTR